MVAYLEKSEGNDGFHQIIDFLYSSHIKYALTENPTIYASLIKQFWQTAALSIIEDGVMAITATIDRNVKQMALVGYVTTSDSLTFQKGHFSPQWKFFIHTILHCLSPKKTGWELFSSNIATAIICLHGEPSTPESSPSRITSSPSLSPQHTSICAPSTSQPPNIQTTHVAEETTPMPHDSPIQSVHSLGRDEVKTRKARRKAMIVISEDEDVDDPSKQGSSLIEELDMDVDIPLVPPHATDQGRKLDDTQVSGQPEDQLGVFSVAKVLADAAEQGRSVGNVQTYTRHRRRVNTASTLVSTVDVSTVSEMVNTVGLKARDKGKAFMQESKPTKKIKKRIQVQMSIDEELARKLHEEELARFNDEQEAIDIARKQKVIAEGDQAHDINWSDPAVIRYHTLQNRPKSVAEVRKSITVQEVERQSTEEEKGKKSDDSSKPTRKKTLVRKRASGNGSQESVKKQKLEDDTEKKELKAYLDIVPEDEFVMEVESLETKQDVMDLHRLVEESSVTCDERLEIVEVKVSSFDGISFRSLGEVRGEIDKTKSTREGLKTVNTELGASKELRANEISKKINMEDLADILNDTRYAFFTLDSSTDEPIIVSYMSEEEENAKMIKTLKILQDLKEIPSKLETFTSTISNLSSQVAELKKIQWELPTEFLDLPHLASSV
nr:hypothetical protein [Tanacetum cinerariifolium]